MNIVYAPRALRDIDDILAYIQQRNPAAARTVSFAIERAVELSAQVPLTGGKTDVPNLYRRPLVQFPYTIFYGVDADHDRIEVLRVVHGARMKDLARLPDDPTE